MIRTFGLRTLTGSAQPVIGDVTTAAMNAPIVGQNILVPVANSAIYQPGDRIVIDPLLSTRTEYKVEYIPSGGVTLSCSGSPYQGYAHTSGAIIQLADACIDLVVLPNAGGTGPVFVGPDNTITNVPGGNVISRIEKVVAGTPGVAFHFAGGVGANIINTAEGWMVGNAGDQVFTYALVL